MGIPRLVTELCHSVYFLLLLCSVCVNIKWRMQACEFYLIICLTTGLSSAQFKVQIKLSLTPKEPIYTGDTVTMECRTQGNIPVQQCSWFKRSEPNMDKEIEGITQATYLIQSASQSDSGVYYCNIKNPFQFLVSSNPVTLTIQERTSRLRRISGHMLESVFVGDQVHLHCQVDGNPIGWQYELHKTGDRHPQITQVDQNFIISPVTFSHSGEYRCRAGKGDLYSNFSDPIQLLVLDLSVILISSSGSSVKVGSSFSLHCTTMGAESSNSDFIFTFLKDNITVRKSSNSSVLPIEYFEETLSGNYMCAVESPGGGRTYSNMISIQVEGLIAVTLSVKEEACRKATLTLKTRRKTVKFTDNVTLDCSINGTFTGLTYHWHKDHQTDWGESRENTITIPFVTESDSGQYRCAAYTSGPYPVAFSCQSNAVKLSIQGLLTATLMRRDQRESVYIGEDVTLVCSIENSYTGWKYRWFKDGYSDRYKSNEHTLTISSLNTSDSGEYQCAAYRDGPYPVFVSTASKALTLSVHERKAELQITSSHTDGRIFEGDEVHLSCNVDGDPVMWKFELYKTGNETPYRVEMKKKFTISPVTLSHSRGYRCRAVKGHLHSRFSDPVQLHVLGLSLENKIRLAISGLVLVVLLIIVAECLWIKAHSTFRSNEAGCTTG